MKKYQPESIEHRPIVIPKGTIDLLLKQDKPDELIALYTFYYYTAIWQKTNQPRCTGSFVQAGLGWGRDKVRRVKKRLILLGLISDVRHKDNRNACAGWYIQVKYYWSQEAIETKFQDTTENATGRESRPVVKKAPNAYSCNKVNAYNSNSANSQKNNNSLEGGLKDFNRFWKSYPERRRINKRASIDIWYQLNPDPSLVEQIIEAANKYAAATQKDETKFIMSPHRWLEGERWLDEPVVELGELRPGIPFCDPKRVFELMKEFGDIDPDVSYQDWLTLQTA